MKQLHVRVGGLLSLVGSLGLLAPALAAPKAKTAEDDRDNKKPAVHTLTIYNGELKTVHYFTNGLSEGEKADVRDLQRAQNDVSFASYNKALAEQPIGPGYVRPVGYGYGGYGYGGYGYGGYPFYYSDIVPTYFSNLNYILSNSAPLYGAYMPYYGFGYGTYGTPAVGYSARPIVGAAYVDRGSTDVPVTKTLREEVSLATKSLDVAMARVMDSPNLAKAMDLPKASKNGIGTAGFDRDRDHPMVTVNMKNGKPIKGRLVEEDKDAIVVNTGDEDVEIRKSETVSIGRARPKDKKKPKDKKDE